MLNGWKLYKSIVFMIQAEHFSLMNLNELSFSRVVLCNGWILHILILKDLMKLSHLYDEIAHEVEQGKYS